MTDLAAVPGPGGLCSVDGCELPFFSQGWCQKHYTRVRRHGTTEGPRSWETRFWSKVQKTDTCWIWTGTLMHAGYGHFRLAGKYLRAHRVSYELSVGPIPDGLVIDHLCRMPPCVNPGHLEPVTVHENTIRGRGPSATNAKKTHCKRGHALAGDNLERLGSQRRRGCRTCHNAAARVRYLAAKAALGKTEERTDRDNTEEAS